MYEIAFKKKLMPEKRNLNRRRRLSDRFPNLDSPPLRDSIFFRRKTDDLAYVLKNLNRWWDSKCLRSGLDPEAPTPALMAYHLIELVKNALRYADGVGVRVHLTKVRLSAVVVDDGEGFDDPQTDMLMSWGGGHGLINAVRFADEFEIDSKGQRWAKDGLDDLRLTGDGDCKKGARIRISKDTSATQT